MYLFVLYGVSQTIPQTNILKGNERRIHKKQPQTAELQQLQQHQQLKQQKSPKDITTQIQFFVLRKFSTGAT